MSTRAEANQKKTALEVDRYRPLAGRGSVSQQELDNTVQSQRGRTLPPWRPLEANVVNAKRGRDQGAGGDLERAGLAG